MIEGIVEGSASEPGAIQAFIQTEYRYDADGENGDESRYPEWIPLSMNSSHATCLLLTIVPMVTIMVT